MTTETQAEEVPHRGALLYVVHFSPPSMSSIERLPKHLRNAALENVRTTTLLYRSGSLPMPGAPGRLYHERAPFDVSLFLQDVRDNLVRGIDDAKLHALLGSDRVEDYRRGYECCYIKLVAAGDNTELETKYSHDILGRYRRGYREVTMYEYILWTFDAEEARAKGLPLPPKPRGG